MSSRNQIQKIHSRPRVRLPEDFLVPVASSDRCSEREDNCEFSVQVFQLDIETIKLTRPFVSLGFVSTGLELCAWRNFASDPIHRWSE